MFGIVLTDCLRAKGSSWFILGAGETLTCEMQYGELAWPMVSVIAMEGSIFSPSSSAAPVLALEEEAVAGVGQVHKHTIAFD